MTGDNAGPELRVVIADDHAPTRADVRAALEAGGFTVCAEAPDAPGAVASALEHRPDVALLDVRMPGGGGIAAAKAITSSLPDTAVVMLTVSRDDSDLFDALRAGASGYLLKDTDPGRLPHALRGVLDGEAALPRTLVARLVTEFRERERRAAWRDSELDSLTQREWEVLEMMRQGLTTVEMAGRLFVASVTVRSHVSAILRKLRVPDRDAAVQLLEGGSAGPWRRPSRLSAASALTTNIRR